MLFPNSFGYRDPFATMRTMMRDFDRAMAPQSAHPVYPPVNVWQGDDAVAVTAELPGVESDNLEISVNGNVLTISGKRAAPDVGEDATWHRRERGHGEFSRTVRLPFETEGEKVEARFQTGVLRIVVGRPEARKPRRIEIKAA